ncbi:acyl-CoA dehydrogenase family protein [Kordiimonas sp. SCSIO 12610]|uniref:acyl-CoA dehydrogenase family protein n=1 Tax=Kordiimonas sp. SCSIO 12610 TaxID=2829597 RepID=UPI00210D9029|nr:acyl-CoA dehydrogenase family protein [Kordiimonas sp. SCSIO 12610]UTW56772.1 acyl-CoA/acyl-ACP dehydrogenase [Kordiimonas sp. SCSIO 12610]
MALVLNEEQQLLKESAEGFFAEKAPVSQLRQLRDDKSEQGFAPELWQEMAEMGFTGLLADEDMGGTGFGYVGAGIVAEAMGTTLAASPFLSSSVIALSALSGFEGDAAETLAASVAAGETVATLALDETSKHAPEKTAMKAVKSDSGYVLNGMKTFVPDGHVADKIIVLARTSEEAGNPMGLSVFVVDRGTSGLIVDRTSMADSRNWAKITFENVSVSADNLLGTEGEGWKTLELAIDKARLVIAAELLGISQEAYRTTMEYLKERKQFDTIIGSFQALQHRAAHLYSEIEVTRSAVLKGLQVADEGQNVAWFASLAKAKASKTAELATNEAIQMHGGIGMTDEYDIGLYIKRARVLQHLYGDFNFHSDRFASLSGY